MTPAAFSLHTATAQGLFGKLVTALYACPCELTAWRIR
ncbi:hypothetical protein CHCC20335_3481 [Bacillus paralicheniformis]|nr:hypothetical protein CHCC20335_3481 [Bacillus paralicheniformis]